MAKVIENIDYCLFCYFFDSGFESRFPLQKKQGLGDMLNPFFMPCINFPAKL